MKKCGISEIEKGKRLPLRPIFTSQAICNIVFYLKFWLTPTSRLFNTGNKIV
jgi:hypothetical protein